jgi:hypothetical protein
VTQKKINIGCDATQAMGHIGSELQVLIPKVGPNCDNFQVFKISKDTNTAEEIQWPKG